MPTNPNTIGAVTYLPANSGQGSPAPVFGAALQKCINVANGIGTQWLAMSTYPGVDPTGATDSWAAVKAAVGQCAAATAAGTPLNLLFDCPVLVSIGTDASRTIFLPNNIKIMCVGTGVIITDAIMLHLFDIINMVDVTFIDLAIMYIGNFGEIATDQQTPGNAYSAVISTYNDTYAKGFMGPGASGSTTGSTPGTYPATGPFVGGVRQWTSCTFSNGGSNAFPSATNACALINISGNSDRITFVGKTRGYVPDGVAASYFIPVFISVFPNWVPGTVRDGNPPCTNTNGGGSPQHVLIEDLYLDGCLMGIVGTVRYMEIVHCRSLRYSDMQNNNGGSIGGNHFSPITLASSPSGATSSVTLATAWAYQNQNHPAAFSDGSVRTINFTNGSTTATFSGGALGTGLSTTMLVNFSDWFAPPHLIYLHQLDFANSFPTTVNLGTIYDEGLHVGTPNTRSNGSGYINSIKLELANGTAVSQYTTLRPHGGMDLLSFGGENGTITKLYVQHDSSVFRNGQLLFTSSLSSATSATLVNRFEWGAGQQTFQATFSDGSVRTVTVIYGQTSCTWSGAVTASNVASFVNTTQLSGYSLRFPSSPPIANLSIDIEAIDTALVPAGFSILGDGQPGNTCVNMKSRVTYKDWTSASCGYAMGGSNMNIDSTIIFRSCSTQNQYIGSIINGSVLAIESNFKTTLVGWRTAVVNFSGSSVTTASTSQTLAAAFPFPSGTYTVAFPTGEQRQVAATNGSTAVTLSSVLTQTSGVNASIQFLTGNNFTAMKSQIVMAKQGLAYGNRVELIDATNGYHVIGEDNILTERWTQGVQVYPPAGGAFDTSIVLPNGYSIDEWACTTNVALGTSSGLTGYTIGWNGAATAISGSLTFPSNTSNQLIPYTGPISLGGSARTVRITPTGGNFDGTGSIYLSVRLRGSSMMG